MKTAFASAGRTGVCVLALLLAAVLFLPCQMVLAEEEEEKSLYTARSYQSFYIREEKDMDSRRLVKVPKGKRIPLYSFDPAWAEVEYEGVRGYILRDYVDDVKPRDKAVTSPYGVLIYQYVAQISGDAEVRSERDGGEVLYTLHDGTLVALIGFEEGWGKLICKRQYAYINSNCLDHVQMVDRNLDAPRTDVPIAAYVSFYGIQETESNIGRMKNIGVACDKMNVMRFPKGANMDFNRDVGPYTRGNGYFPAPILTDGKTAMGYGGGTCQVSSTLYNTLLQLPGVQILRRRPHGAAGAAYLPHGMDAAVGNKSINFVFRNDYDYPIRIDAHCSDGALYISVYRAEEGR